MAISVKKVSKKVESKELATKKTSNVKHDLKSSSPQNDVEKLRIQNKVLLNALNQVKQCAKEHVDKRFDLVWFALNRTRYPNHPFTKDLTNSESHREDLENLRSNDCDFHHGFNCGVLATSRLINQIADAVDIANGEIHEEEGLITDHMKKVQKLKTNFPDLSVDDIPKQE